MKLSNLRGNLLFFLIIYIFSVSLFTFLSYKFFISDFILLEERLNKNNINVFLGNMNKRLDELKKTTKDYSTWDETYKFIDDQNNEYLYENFREGSNTLEQLQIDALIFSNLKNEIVFSKYNSTSQIENKNRFEKTILKQLEQKKELSSIISYKDIPIYIVKSEVKKSDNSGVPNGYLISIKIISEEQLILNNNILFEKITISNKQTNKLDKYTLSLDKIKNINISYEILEDRIVNYIDILDFNKQFLFTIIASNKDLIINKGKSAITTFNIIGSLIFLLIFIVVYQNQRLIINQNKILNKKIIKRTRQLNRAYKSLKSKNRALFKLANIDSLTNINNRASFFTKSIQLLRESNKTYSEFAILIIDIDYFKKINDKYSHAVGDKVLMEFTNSINSIISDDMVFGRIGGEEFCITVYDKNYEFVYDLCENIRRKCAQTCIEIDDLKINFTVSIGIAFKENTNQTIDEILHKADILLYEAKKNGRNRVIRTI